MFIIENNSAYLIMDKIGKRIKFNTDLSYVVTDEIIEDISSYRKFTYEEMLKKLNVKFFMNKAIEESQKKLNVKEYTDKIEILEKENKELKEEIEKLKKELETSKNIKPKKEKNVSNEE